MTQELDWSDLSKLQTRDGQNVIFAKRDHTYKADSLSSMLLVTEQDGLLESYNVSNDGRVNTKYAHDGDIVHRPPEPPQTKKVTLWRPEWRQSPSGWISVDCSYKPKKRMGRVFAIGTSCPRPPRE